MGKKLISLLAAIALVATPTLTPTQASAAGLPSMIRDAEIETTIRQYATPLFAAAGLDPRAVHVYLLQVDDLNAFVAGGMNLFLYTGLIIRSETPNQLIGVMAHETGHIAGGHLARTQDALEKATTAMIIAMVLGLGAAAAAGSGGAAAGGLLGAGNVGQGSILQYTRTQEASADAAAMTFLDRTHQSARGLLQFFGILRQMEFVLVGHPNPYLLNHPLTTDRIASVQAHVDTSPYSNVADPPGWVVAHKRMVAKLIGFLWPLPRVLQRYPETDTGLYARYARSIAYYRAGQLPRALTIIDGLIAENPADPYFHELRGQMLYESGRGTDALPSYEKALTLAPDQPLLRYELAQVQIEQEDPGLVKPAVEELKQVVIDEPRNPDAWQLLGVAYGRDGQMGMASLALAEAAAANNRPKRAREQAKRALDQLPYGTPAWLRAQDIVSTSKEESKDSGGLIGN
jgi:predicted Zn-dependent protease